MGNRRIIVEMKENLGTVSTDIVEVQKQWIDKQEQTPKSVASL